MNILKLFFLIFFFIFILVFSKNCQDNNNFSADHIVKSSNIYFHGMKKTWLMKKIVCYATLELYIELEAIFTSLFKELYLFSFCEFVCSIAITKEQDKMKRLKLKEQKPIAEYFC